MQEELFRAQHADLCVVRPEYGLAGEEIVDERGVDERLERFCGIESLEPLLGRRRVGQLLLHRLFASGPGRQRQFEAAARKRNAGRERLRSRLT